MRKLITFVFLLVLAGGALVGWQLFTPVAPPKQVIVDFPPGTSTRSMARQLAEFGVIGSEWHLVAAKALNPGSVLQAGEYAFEKPASAWDVFRKIARGEIYYREITVPEGANMFDIAGELEKQGLMKAADFLRVARSPALIRDLAPQAPSLEGYLFPASYRLTRRTTPSQLAAEMTRRFRRAWEETNPPASTDVHRMVTLASLVEKETAVPSERRAVSAVYTNRLRTGMKLDCDPTVIYAALLENRFRGTIYRSDLDNPHPYNTYRNPGLPPGPIANPGLESLKAALNPADSDHLFFVAKPDGSGEHVFSTTLTQHNAAVQSYRNGVAQ